MYNFKQSPITKNVSNNDVYNELSRKLESYQISVAVLSTIIFLIAVLRTFRIKPLTLQVMGEGGHGTPPLPWSFGLYSKHFKAIHA